MFKTILGSAKIVRADHKRNTLRSRKLRIESLEERLAPVIGAFDFAPVVEPGSSFDAVVRLNAATGTLLSTGRHVITAAHVVGASPGDRVVFETIGTDGLPQSITTYTKANYLHPTEDLAIVELASLAPLNVKGFTIYSGNDELGKTVTLIGYGNAGTGTIGQTTSLLDNDFYGFSAEVVRISINGNPTGGTFKFSLQGSDVSSITLPHNFTQAQLEVALESLAGVQDVYVALVGDTTPYGDGIVENKGHPYAGSYEVIFTTVDYEDRKLPNLVVDSDLVGGEMTVDTLREGGAIRLKRYGFNKISNVTSTRLNTDFDDGTSATDYFGDKVYLGSAEVLYAGGDSGSPILLNNKIVAVHKAKNGLGVDGNEKTNDFGTFSSHVRLNPYLSFLNGILSKSYDLVLDLRTQIEGNDGTPDEVLVFQVGGQIRIRINGQLRHVASIAKVNSITILGSKDDENIKVLDVKKEVPAIVRAGAGNDNVSIARLPFTRTVIVQGQEGDDVISIDANKMSKFSPSILALEGGAGTDTLAIGSKNNPFIKSYDVRFGKVLIAGRSVNHTSFDFLSITLPNAGGEVLARSLDKDVMLNVFGGTGNDALTLGTGNVFQQIKGKVIFQGMQGKNRIFVNDAFSQSTTFDFDTTSVKINGELKLALFTNTELINFSTNDLSNNVAVHGIAAGTQLNVKTRGGADQISVAPDSKKLDDVLGKLVVYGGNGFDQVVVHDEQHSEFNSTYFVVNASARRVGTGFIHSAQAESFELLTGHEANRIDVSSTDLGTKMKVVIGDGDHVRLSPILKRLDPFKSRLTIVDTSASGTSVVEVNDQLTNQGKNPYVVTSNSLDRVGFGGLTFLNVDELVLELSGAANKLAIESMAPTTRFEVNTAAGADLIHVQATEGTVELDLGIGSDKVILSGTIQDETLVIDGLDFTFDPWAISGTNVERVDFAGGSGVDKVLYRIADTMTEAVVLRAGEVANKGSLVGSKSLDAYFTGTEFVEVFSRVGEGDTLSFLGTRFQDEFLVDLVADRTAADPVVEFRRNNINQLSLIGFQGIDRLTINGLQSNDRFDVTTTGTSSKFVPGLAVIGATGADSMILRIEEENLMDVNEQQKDSDSGEFQVIYPDRQFFISYDETEENEKQTF